MESQILRFNVVKNLVDPSLHCQIEVQNDPVDAWFLLQLLKERDSGALPAVPVGE